MKKKILTKLGVHREIIRTLGETHRLTVVGGKALCTATQLGSNCITTDVVSPRED